ncbi:hypothetical protein [Haloechinothrix halophila]|uniref:hypothetical protein n=1 Tax=Haloechinothrix halophila TaxID=1069073 RepID=UPI0005563CD8
MPSSDDPTPPRRTSSSAPASRRTSPRRENASRLDEVFGQILPETTSDEREPSSHEASGSSDDWYLENRPPHH